MIEIKHRWNGSVLYTAENAQDVRQAVEEAVKADANLTGAYLARAYLTGAYLARANLTDADLTDAYLTDANLTGAYLARANLTGAYLARANLTGAYLTGANLAGAYLARAYLARANLTDANLTGANLADANLTGAYLTRANLTGANLTDATDWRSPLWATRQDFFSILDQAPAEVPTLRDRMTEGKIEGSTYSGPCSCLAGTIATAHGCSVDDLPDELGIETNSRRPAEQWFLAITEGQKPLPTDTKDWPDEGTFRLSLALVWLDEWTQSRTAVAAALDAQGALEREFSAEVLDDTWIELHVEPGQPHHTGGDEG